jgi:hypothetical protein
MSHWLRPHSNGWTATVSSEPDGTYNCSSHRMTEPSPQFAHRGFTELSKAQEKADELVDQRSPHVCTCRPWRTVPDHP